MVNKELLVKAYTSRPRKVFIPFAFILLLVLAFSTFVTFIFPKVPSLIEQVNSFGDITPPLATEPITFSTFLSTYIAPALCAVSSLLVGFLTLGLASRKWWYHFLNTFIVLGIVGVLVSNVCSLFLLNYIPENFHSIISLVSTISTYVSFIASFLSLLFCFFDNHLPLRKYRPIYKRLKFLMKNSSSKSEKKELKKKFNYYFKKKKFDDLLLLLYGNEFSLESGDSLSSDAYELIKKEIIKLVSELKEKELDRFHSNGMDFAIKKERQTLLDSISNKEEEPNNSEVKKEVPPIASNEDNLIEEPIVSKKMLKKAKKAEIKALKKAEKEKKKQSKKETAN